MKKERFAPSLVLAALALLGFATDTASAAVLTCQSELPLPYERTWTLGDASACDSGPGNPNSSADVNALVGTAFDGTWTKRGDVTKDGDFSDLLNVSLNSGSTWGTQPVSGTWTLRSDFWSLYGAAIITIHVGGNPQSLPDDFGAFRITDNALTGSWSFSQIADVQGGGLSNLSIWTSGTPTRVPEPGTLALLGLGLAGLGLTRRRKA